MRAEPQLTFLPDRTVPARGRFVVYQPDGSGVASELGRQAGRIGLDGVPDQAELVVVEDDGRPARRAVSVHAATLECGVRALLEVREDSRGAMRRLPDTVRAWALAAHAARRLVLAHRLVPSLAITDERTVHGVWRALPSGDDEAQDLLDRLAAALPPAGHAVPHPDDPAVVWRAEDLLGAFCDAVADLAARRGNPDPREGRPRARLLPWTARWEEALRDTEHPVVPLRDDAADLVAGVVGWHAASAETDAVGLVELSLVAPDDPADEWRLDLGVRTETGTLLTASRVWAQAGEEDGLGAARQEALLAGLGRCARVFPPVEAALSEAVPESVALSVAEAWEFVSEVAPLLEGSGVVVHLPDELAADNLRIRLRVGADEVSEEAGEEAGEVGYAWEVALGEDTLTEDEVAALLAADDPLVFWRGRWVRVDPELTDQLRVLGEPGTLSFGDALALGLAGAQPAGWDGPTARTTETEVVADGAVARLLERLHDAADVPPVDARPAGFSGELRPYQQRGVAWLNGMGALGFGAVLADDMGLGKTVQLIGYLLARGGGPHLVVCPTSVVGNWEREIGRFAPELEVTRHHGADRNRDIGRPAGVWLTTYGTLRRDVDLLAAVDWDVVTLDEAQHVKNPSTAGARAVRRISAAHSVAMTGTPLENRLAELWSLMDVTNPGLLSTRSAFGRRFVTPIEKRRDPATALRLRRLVAPFILRREKTDPEVISDLPDKIERTVVCPLTPEQAGLYERAVDEVFGERALEGATGMERRGRVLALLTRLKQICNHPAHAQGEAESAPLIGRSGKLAACRDLVRDAVDGDEQVLIFTQFVAMGRRLAAQLSEDLDTEIPLLHGGVGATARDRMVAGFQAEEGADPVPVLVVSLRAGGTGLNLTAATQVIHYDRWWNPAVEDQATDRAHRIGQHRTVEVHKLVTAGTVEERVAELLESKRALADAVVGAGESWVTELGDDELAELVALGEDAAIEDLDEEAWHDDEAFEEAS